MNTLAKQQMTQERRGASVPASRIAKRVASVFAVVFGGMGIRADRMHALCAWIGLNSASKESRGITRSGNSTTKQHSIIRGSNPQYAGGQITA